MTAEPRELKVPDVTPEEVRRLLPKTATISIRLSEADKESIRGAAEALGLSITDYVLGAHAAVIKHLPLAK